MDVPRWQLNDCRTALDRAHARADELEGEIDRLTRELEEARERAESRLQEANSQQRIAIRREEERDRLRAAIEGATIYLDGGNLEGVSRELHRALEGPQGDRGED